MLDSLAEIHKLRNFQSNLEKTEHSVVENIAKLDDSQKIKEVHKEITESRNILTKNIQNDILQIFGAIKKVKSLVQKDTIESTDLKILKKEMITIQGNIQSLKKESQLPLQALQLEEEKLNDDIYALESKMKEWDKPSYQKLYQTEKKFFKPYQPVITSNNICQEAKDFMDFLTSSGGHENGWSVDDHNLFLKLRPKNKDIRKLVDALQSKLPDLTEQDIIQHEQWYKTYVNLRDKQKVAIQKWRNGKCKEDKLEKVQQFENSKEDKSKLKNLEEEKKRKLQLWQQTQLEKKRLEYTLKKGEDLKKLIQEEEEKKKYQEVKAVVQDWKAKKVAVIEAEKIEKEHLERIEREKRATHANKLIKQYQFQDQLYIQRKIKTASQTKPPNPTLPAVNSPIAKRDRDRLYKPTKTWLMRTFGDDYKEKKDKKKQRFNLETLQKLGKPNWRKTV